MFGHDGTRQALAWSEWFCAVIRRGLAFDRDGPNAQHWRNCSLWWSKPGWPTVFRAKNEDSFTAASAIGWAESML
jgi:hypothetical protein